MRKETNNKKRLVYTIGIIAIMMLVAVSATVSAVPKNIYVSASQVPSWYDATHVYSIQNAINVSNNGDIIYVWSGMYTEDVYIDKQVTLIGDGKATTVVIGDGSLYGVFQVSISNVEISGFTVMGGEDMGIFIYAPSVRIHDNDIIQNSRSGIEINSEMAFNCVIQDNSFSDNSWRSIYLKTGANNNIIRDNDILDGGIFGIQVKMSDDNTILDNDISDCNEAGIYLSESDSNTINGNTFDGCSQNIDGAQ